MARRLPIFVILLLSCAVPARVSADSSAPGRVLDARSHHLGLAGSPPEWREFDGHPAEAPMLAITFTAHPNPRPASLFIHQRDVKVTWPVLLNARKRGTLT